MTHAREGWIRYYENVVVATSRTREELRQKSDLVSLATSRTRTREVAP